MPLVLADWTLIEEAHARSRLLIGVELRVRLVKSDKYQEDFLFVCPY